MNKKGFTLIEMLVVIAIIAVLVAIVIPTVSSATEKAKEAKDAANIRAAIAEVTTEALAGNTGATATVTLSQTGAFSENADLKDIGGYELSQFTNASTVVDLFSLSCISTTDVLYFETPSNTLSRTSSTVYVFAASPADTFQSK